MQSVSEGDLLIPIEDAGDEHPLPPGFFGMAFGEDHMLGVELGIEWVVFLCCSRGSVH